jgi:hypothetical protein
MMDEFLSVKHFLPAYVQNGKSDRLLLSCPGLDVKYFCIAVLKHFFPFRKISWHMDFIAGLSRYQFHGQEKVTLPPKNVSFAM